MIRILLENLILFLLPTLIYVGYVIFTQPAENGPGDGTKSAVQAFNEAPFLWLFGAGAVLVVLTLILFGSTSGGKPGQQYVPPAMKDGRIEPGHIE